MSEFASICAKSNEVELALLAKRRDPHTARAVAAWLCRRHTEVTPADLAVLERTGIADPDRHPFHAPTTGRIRVPGPAAQFEPRSRILTRVRHVYGSRQSELLCGKWVTGTRLVRRLRSG